jgi:hypothetical protein
MKRPGEALLSRTRAWSVRRDCFSKIDSEVGRFMQRKEQTNLVASTFSHLCHVLDRQTVQMPAGIGPL